MGIKKDESTYDNYECTLTPETQQIAKCELREDQVMRDQALGQFRQWIEKHPQIKSCRTDANFLLRFLRTKKFSLPMAQEMLERYLTIRQLYPQWFQNLDVEDPEIEAIIDRGYLVPLLKRDQFGRRVILSSAARFDPSKYSSEHMAKVHSIVLETLMDDEENQVRGYAHINDESGLTMSHLSAWSLTDIRNMLKCFQVAPMRHKDTHFVNIPSFGTKIIEFAVSLLNEKLKKRITVHKSLEELQKNVDPKILPKEYGGETPLSEMIDEFKKTLRAKRKELLALDDMFIKISSRDYEYFNGENLSGSFRKLEVD